MSFFNSVFDSLSALVDGAVAGGYVAALAIVCLIQYFFHLYSTGRRRKERAQHRREMQGLKHQLDEVYNDRTLSHLENHLLREFVSETEIGKAVDLLLRNFAPDPRRDFSTLIQQRGGNSVVDWSRGLSDESRQQIERSAGLSAELAPGELVALEGRSLTDSEFYQLLAPSDREKTHELFLLALEAEGQSIGVLATTSLYPKNGPREPQLALAKRLMASIAGNLKRHQDMQRTADELRTSQEMLERQSVTNDELADIKRRALLDGLTEVANRRHFDEQIEIAFQSARDTGDEFSLLLCDLDHFKEVNDTWGHQAGDQVLRTTAQILQDQAYRTRSNDSVLVARYGGEEFAVLLPGIGRAGALRIGESIRLAVAAATVMHRQTTINVRISIGVASWPCDADSVEDLIAQADTALYAAKQGGRNQVRSAPNGNIAEPCPLSQL